MASGHQFVGQGEALPSDAVVVRWGVSPLDKMRDAAKKYRDRRLDRGLPPEFALSGEYRLGYAADEIARRTSAPNVVLYKQMRATTSGALIDAGFEVIQEGPLGHASIKLGGDPTDEVPTDDVLNAVDAALDTKEPNPRWTGK